ncbi:MULTISPECIES: cupin domain-containing protein [Streptomyces]|uniref:Cupin domain-containing protein n=1 Tax=Streptomyces doebereineriae TaxID=3075528 RepID=A0ABU2V9H3_9ACTN|nr:cupin domain-containing protein [Streptomyces sp. DSM 41640]MDT0482207.1 cupin domain-containing protein [Streptomyces sp. DSM 41640]
MTQDAIPPGHECPGFLARNKLKGEFVWHTHEDTDEPFLVISGRLTIQLRDGDVVLEPGELFVVPRGVEHVPWRTRRPRSCCSNRRERSIPVRQAGR